jgi:hypothetical protein
LPAVCGQQRKKSDRPKIARAYSIKSGAVILRKRHRFARGGVDPLSHRREFAATSLCTHKSLSLLNFFLQPAVLLYD